VAAFLIDESLPRVVTRELLAAGHDVSDVRDVGLRGAPDEKVFDRAQTENRILVSGDVDFANTLRFLPGSHVGIVVLRLPNDWAPASRANRALQALTDILPELAQGALAIVDPKRVRLLRAPAR
jgi:predicted nuclease of predicted toxin-antitoxin system